MCKWAGLLGIGFGAAWPATARAQYINQYFPQGVPGYQQEPGVTVASRLRPAYDPLGVRLGSFMLHPELDESLGYNSNVAGFANTPGSWFVRTAPSLSINSDWSRNQLGATVTMDNTNYFSAPRQNYTDWTATIGAGYTIGEHDAILGYSHLSLHEDPNQIGSVASTTPVPYQVDDLRGSYTFDLGRLSFTPRLDLQYYRFSDATIGNLPVSQASQDRLVLSGALETRYALSEFHSLVFVVEGIDSHYTNTPSGVPTNNSTSFLALGGIDYQASGVWRYRLLAGVETRQFEAPQLASHTAPIAEASVIWTPTGLTSVTGFLSRTIEDPVAAGAGSYTYTRAGLVVDHEYLRNVLLQGRLGFENAEYLQGGGNQNRVTAGAGVQWLLNRNMRLVLDYSFTDQSGSGSNVAFTNQAGLPLPNNTSFTRSIVLLTLRLAL